MLLLCCSPVGSNSAPTPLFFPSSGRKQAVGASQFNLLLQQYGPAILNAVNFNAGRMRPNFSFDAATGATLFHKEGKDISFEIEGHNLTDKLNVLNFASLFSGTAVAPPASVSARLKIGF